MAIGYRVNLGPDNSAWTGDIIDVAPSNFTPGLSATASAGGASSTVGGATWKITGTLADGTVVQDQIMGGVFQTDASGALYFVPDDPVGTIASAVVETSPVYTANETVLDGGNNTFGSGTSTSTTPDVIYAGAGDDTIYGGAIRAPQDHDVIYGGTGNDRIYGTGGIDRISGGLGNDYIEGGYGGDIADYSAATGNINIALPPNGGTQFTDAQTGGQGADYLIGIDGIIGGSGNDTLTGYDAAGIDVDQSIYTNYFDGGAGNDSIDGRAGSDFLFGGTGSDTIIGGVGGVRVGFNDTVNPYEDQVFGGEGNDYLYGDDSPGTIAGGGGDLIQGGAGNDYINAGAGNDVVFGGADSDTIFGMAGADRLYGGSGNDTIDGGAGNDFISGDEGADSLIGGDGFDRFIVGDGDTISDFNNATGQALNDGLTDNNDYVDLTGFYNEANLATINAARTATGLQPYATPLGWLRADQADGVLSDISTANGFASNVTVRINSGASATAPDQLTTDNTGVTCFAADTLIETAGGLVRAIDLQAGDRVMTLDNGLQPIRWVGRRALDSADLTAHPNLRPVRIAKGALGDATPNADLVVSPQHRVLVRSRIAQRMFNVPEVLVAAKSLLSIPGIGIAEDMDAVTYVHILFEDHQVVFSNGAETESLYVGPEALKSIGEAARQEIMTLFPELCPEVTMVGARQLLSRRHGSKLAERHLRNGQKLVN